MCVLLSQSQYFWMFNISAERELLITQGLNDLDVQEDQNAVFICELSVEDIPGEWYKNGERIQPTSTVKIRQEGQLWRGVSRNGAWQSWPLPSRAEDEHWRSVLTLICTSIYPSVHFFLQGPNIFFSCATCDQRIQGSSSSLQDVLNLWLIWMWKV